MTAWEKEISEKLQEAQSIAVRFDVAQSLTEAEKTLAKNNVGITVTTTQVTGDDYIIAFNY